MEKIWYAYLTDQEDSDWGTGTYDKGEAIIEMVARDYYAVAVVRETGSDAECIDIIPNEGWTGALQTEEELNAENDARPFQGWANPAAGVKYACAEAEVNKSGELVGFEYEFFDDKDVAIEQAKVRYARLTDHDKKRYEFSAVSVNPDAIDDDGCWNGSCVEVFWESPSAKH